MTSLATTAGDYRLRATASAATAMAATRSSVEPLSFVGRCRDPKVVHFVGDVWPLRARHVLSDMALRTELLATPSADTGDVRSMPSGFG